MGRVLLFEAFPPPRRQTTDERGYTRQWRKLRAAKLATDPVCEIRTHCPGLVANEVDHKIPIRDWPAGRLIWSNLQSACKSCHSAKTLRENPMLAKQLDKFNGEPK